MVLWPAPLIIEWFINHSTGGAVLRWNDCLTLISVRGTGRTIAS